MTVLRGEVWFADLGLTRGSEQAGTRPVLILQNDVVSQYTTTVLAAPFTTNLRRASYPHACWSRRAREDFSVNPCCFAISYAC